MEPAHCWPLSVKQKYCLHLHFVSTLNFFNCSLVNLNESQHFLQSFTLKVVLKGTVSNSWQGCQELEKWNSGKKRLHKLLVTAQRKKKRRSTECMVIVTRCSKMFQCSRFYITFCKAVIKTEQWGYTKTDTKKMLSNTSLCVQLKVPTLCVTLNAPIHTHCVCAIRSHFFKTWISHVEICFSVSRVLRRMTHDRGALKLFLNIISQACYYYP